MIIQKDVSMFAYKYQKNATIKLFRAVNTFVAQTIKIDINYII